MALALICSQSDLSAELEETPLGRADVERQVAARRDQARIRMPERPVPAVALNLSVSGMLLESEEAVRLGDELDLSFALPPEEAALRPRAEVVRRAGPKQCGVRFVALSAAERARVQRYVESGSAS